MPTIWEGHEYYTPDEVYEMLRKAEELGLDLGPGSDLERLTLEEFDRLVNRIQ